MSSPAKRPRSPAAKRVAAYRQRMREAGYRLKSIWVPDLRNPEVIARIQRAARAIAEHDPDGEEWVDALYQVRDWPAE